MPIRRAPLTSRRHPGTGPTADVVELVLERAGYCCEVRVTPECVARDGMLGDLRGVDWSIQHRLPRGSGGTSNPLVGAASALLLVCGSGTTGCHGHVESERAESYVAGWLIKHGITDPSAASVLVVDRDGVRRRVLLTDDGRYAPAPEVTR